VGHESRVGSEPAGEDRDPTEPGVGYQDLPCGVLGDSLNIPELEGTLPEGASCGEKTPVLSIQPDSWEYPIANEKPTCRRLKEGADLPKKIAFFFLDLDLVRAVGVKIVVA
jgi:hypothetical protein